MDENELGGFKETNGDVIFGLGRSLATEIAIKRNGGGKPAFEIHAVCFAIHLILYFCISSYNLVYFVFFDRIQTNEQKN